MAAPAQDNQIARRVVDDLIEYSGHSSMDGYMSFFKTQQIAETRGFINRQREEANTVRNAIAQLTTLIAEHEVGENQEETFGTLMDLRDDRKVQRVKLQGLNRLIVAAEAKVENKEAQVQEMNN